MKGENGDLSFEGIFGALIKRLNSDIKSWSCCTKVYSVIHRALQDPQLSVDTANVFSGHEQSFFSYRNLEGEGSWEKQLYASQIQLYNLYIKALVCYKMNGDLLVLDSKEVSEKLKEMDLEVIHFTYESLETIIALFWSFMEKVEFNSETRLMRNVVTLMVRDAFAAYRIY